MTFINEIKVKDQPSNAGIEAKLLKYIFRAADCKVVKSYKAYNYQNIQRFERFASEISKIPLKLMFGLA